MVEPTIRECELGNGPPEGHLQSLFQVANADSFLRSRLRTLSNAPPMPMAGPEPLTPQSSDIVGQERTSMYHVFCSDPCEKETTND